jgi:hypothetical protein
MFGQSGNNKKKEDSDAIQKKSARGNMDEYEAMRTIVSENPGLLNRVLEKIRVHRAMNPSENDTIKKASTDNDKKDKSKDKK